MGEELRASLGKNGQKPPFFILGCMDSRVPIPHIFDFGFGDSFYGGVGGEAINPDMVASMEYAVLHGTKLLAILGHTKCGAITAKVEGGTPPSPSLAVLLSHLKMVPGKDKAEQIDNSVHANVGYQIERLIEMSPLIAQKVRAGEVKLVGMVYDVDHGKVNVERPPEVLRALNLQAGCLTAQLAGH